jgi:hypothetical protein
VESFYQRTELREEYEPPTPAKPVSMDSKDPNAEPADRLSCDPIVAEARHATETSDEKLFQHLLGEKSYVNAPVDDRAGERMELTRIGNVVI